MILIKVCLFYCILINLEKFAKSSDLPKAVVFTVATENCDGYERYIRSANHYKIQVENLGLNKKWTGGDMSGPGGAQKINLLKKALEPIKDEKNTLVLFTDSYDVIFVSNLTEIITKFLKTKSKVIFGGENFCWPDKNLEIDYPEVTSDEVRFLNSGLFMGYIPEVYGILNTSVVDDVDDDQYFYTKVFLNEKYRKKFNIKLDTKSDIFSNLNGVQNISFFLKNGEWFVKNTVFNNEPSIIHGNGPSKIYLNSISNYLVGSFINNTCKICNENLIDLQENNLPIITLAIFIENLYMRSYEALQKIYELNYPKKNIYLFIHSDVWDHDYLVLDYINKFGSEYQSYKYTLKSDGMDNNRFITSKIKAKNWALKTNSDYLFYVNSYVRLTEPNVLRDLLKYNKSVIAPLVVQNGTQWANFWGALDHNGYYARSNDYYSILQHNTLGIWNVPQVSSCYLMKTAILNKIKLENTDLDSDMNLCYDLREAGVFMYIINMKNYGNVLLEEEKNEVVPASMLYALLTNQTEWEKRYIHPDFWNVIKPITEYEEICGDVYRFPIVTEQFCDDILHTIESFDIFHDNDIKVKGSDFVKEAQLYEIGLDAIWTKFLTTYAKLLTAKVYAGYTIQEETKSLLKYIVRQKPKELFIPELYDLKSTLIMTLELNQFDTDYEGSGRDFLRYNCVTADTPRGWITIHPGRITHNYEDLAVTKGTRYAIVSFIQN